VNVRRLVGRAALVLVSVVLSIKAADVAVGLIDPYGISHFEHKAAFNEWCLRPWEERCKPGFAVMELVPGQRVEAGVTYAANALGFRGRETTLDKPDDVWRIVVLGDSVAFGWGVEADERFTEVAEARLNEGRASQSEKGPRIEILNLGVPGYETNHQGLVFTDKALPLDPDAVVFAFNWNDVQLEPDEVVTHVLGEFQNRMNAKGWIAKQLIALNKRPFMSRWLPELRSLFSYTTIYALKPGDEVTLREIYASMKVGIEKAGAVYQTAHAVAKERGVGLGVIDLYAFEPIEAELKRRGVPYGDMSFDGFDSDMTVRNSPSDPHPNPRGHQMIAEQFVKQLRALALLPPEGS